MAVSFHLLDVLAVNNNILTFTSCAIGCIQRMAILLNEYELGQRLLKSYNPLNLLSTRFTTITEQRIVRIIYDQVIYDNVLCHTVTDIDVISAIDFIITKIFYEAFCYTNQSNITTMLDSYPLTLLCEICNVQFEHGLILGHNMKAFISSRNLIPNWLPKPFENLLGNTIPLTGHSKSPLTNCELEALFRYLGIRKRIYVELLLGCLFELGQYFNKMHLVSLSESDIINVCNSGWFYLLSFNLSTDNYVSESYILDIMDDTEYQTLKNYVNNEHFKQNINQVDDQDLEFEAFGNILYYQT